MKKALLFIGGLITGVVLTVLVAVLINAANQPNDGFPGLTVFPEKGECIMSKGELEVMQTLASNAALAWTGDFLDSDRLLVLLINYDGVSYYDDQKIKIPTGKCARQIGTYQYTSRNEIMKTVPAVVIE